MNKLKKLNRRNDQIKKLGKKKSSSSKMARFWTNPYFILIV